MTLRKRASAQAATARCRGRSYGTVRTVRVLLTLLICVLGLLRSSEHATSATPPSIRSSAPSAPSAAADAWWNEAWPYRLPVTTTGTGVTEVSIDFGAAFAALGLNAALLDLRSVRVVPYSGSVAGEPLPYAETYSTLLDDAEAPQIGWSGTGVYWIVNDGFAEADTTRASEGSGSLKAVIENYVDGYGYPGVEFRIASGNPLSDWRRYETFIYDVWPEVNESALDQSPDLYWYKLYDTGCPQDHLTQGGPPLALDQWNAASVSLKPLHTCTIPDLKDITRMEFHTRDNVTVPGNSGLWDDGDVLTLWFDNLRLVDQNTGTLRWATDGSTTTTYVYFDTLEHEGHPLPFLGDPGSSDFAATVGAPEAGGYYHKISGAVTDELAVWAAPPVEKIPQAHAPPAATAPLRVQAARGEFEPFQLVVRSPSTQTHAVTISGLDHAGAADTTAEHSDASDPATASGTTIPAANVTLHRVDYVPITQLSDDHGRIGPWPDPLMPLPMGSNVTFPAGTNQPLWFTIEVPRDAVPGIYAATVTIGAAAIPIELEVWDFALPEEIHLAGEWGFGWSNVVETYKGTDGGVQPCYWTLVDALYEDFADHRLTPKGVGWPAGLNYPGGVEYDCAGTLNPDAWGDWDFHTLSQKYLLGGELDNGVGFPTFLIKGPSSNWPPASRPSSFCGETRGTDPPGDAAYNVEWFQYWRAVSDYVGTTEDYDTRGYYHIVNEPQTFDDYDIVAYLSQQTKAHAPNVRILISEQVEPGIYANAIYPSAKIDIWMPTISNYQVQRAHDRQVNHGEEVWWYFLYGDRPPLPNPTVMDRPGIEARIVPWLAWLERVEGLVYYSTTDWSPDPWAQPWINDGNGDGFMFYPPKGSTLATDACDAESNRLVPAIRWELLREGMEDYEYLWLLNQGTPEIGVSSESDALAELFISSRTRFSRVPTDLAATREAIAARLTGPTAAKTASATGVRVGESLTYTLVYNAGNTAHTVTITDTVPTGMEVTGATASALPAPAVDGQTVTWQTDIAARAAVTLTIATQATQLGPSVNTAVFSDTVIRQASVSVLVYDSRVFLPLVLRGSK